MEEPRQRFGVQVSPPRSGEPKMSLTSPVSVLQLSAPSNFFARKRKDFSIRVSVQIAQREENILVADVHGGIQSLLNERPASTPLEQYDFGDAEYTPRDPAELHNYLTEMFTRHFQSLPTPAPALHDGTLSWDDSPRIL